jgi:ABC-type transporter Mla MlaB component
MLEMLSANHYRLHGDIDMQESSALLRELLALPASKAASGPLLTLDVGCIASADSLLLAALLDLQRKLAQRGARLQVLGLSAAMRGLARVYGIESLLENILEKAPLEPSP